MLGQEFGCSFANVSNAESGEKTSKSRILAALQTVEQILRRFLGHPIQTRQLVLCQAVQIGEVLDPFPFDQLVDELLTQSFDVHGIARTEKLQAFLKLRGTGNADAAVRRLAFFADKQPSRKPDTLRHAKMFFLAGALFLDHFDDIRDDVAGALDDHRVADANVLTGDFIHVVQRSAFYHDAADRDGLEASDRRQSAGASDLGLNIENARCRLARL